MATYRVDYFIKRNSREYAAHHITEATNTTEAIKKTKDYIEQHRLPHAFRPRAHKVGSLDLSSVEWKDDGITRNYVKENAEELAAPRKMTPSSLSDAITYCKTFINPYAEELMRRAGNLKTFNATSDTSERSKIVRNAAKSFGILLF